MGLLDDAIREHLDLKRRRGADPAEIERAEREALGPVRRGIEEPEEEQAPENEPVAYDHEADGEVDYGHEPGGEWDERFQEGPEGAESPADSAAAAVHEPVPPEPAVPERPPLDAADPIEEPPAPPAAAAPTPAPHPAAEPPQHVAAETEEYDVEDVLADEGGLWEDAAPEGDADAREPERYGAPEAGEEEGREDMLEETPEFLQDTPDHDRLWFEQRPPRDFDFEG